VAETVPEAHPRDRLRRDLGLRDATLLVVSGVIGSGIFFTPGPIAALLPHPGVILAAWIVGGLLSLAGALANGELGAMFPRAGGDYVYLREAFHPVAGFLVGWLTFFVIYAGTIATLHFSANCRLNQRKVTLIGSTGVITIDILSDFSWLSRSRDSKMRRPFGRSLTESAEAMIAMIADRPMYLLDRLRRRSPHARFIAAADRSFRGAGPPPTPFEEIDYVTRYCHRIGSEIDRQIRECRPESTF